MGLIPKPSFLGLDPKHFVGWRAHQEDAILDAMSAPERFIGGPLPTGFGKSLFAIAQGLLGQQRFAYVTSTKGLSNQLMGEFSSAGLVKIEGKNNYPCVLDPTGQTMTDHAPCNFGEQCHLKNKGSKYFDALRASYRAGAVNTNYSYWMHIYEYGEGLGKFEFLILDEVHDAVDSLADFLAVRVPSDDIKGFPKIPGREHWAMWATARRAEIKDRIKALSYPPIPKVSYRRLIHYRRLFATLARLASAGNGDGWILEYDSTGAAVFQLLWPGKFAEMNLFRGIPRVLAMSATMRPKTLELMGVKPHQMRFVEYKSDFPVARRPVIWVPTVSMNYANESDPAYFGAAMDRIDQILRGRDDRKGIIHSVSYRRAEKVFAKSRHRDRMIVHDGRPGSLVAAVERYRAGRPGAVLVSPSVDTGWDFPYEQCEYQIIMKIPFPDSQSEVSKARAAADKEYVPYVTMGKVVQMTGRPMRAVDDQCETFIIDDNWGKWFLRRNKKFAPQYFIDATRELGQVPKPPPRLEKQKK